MTDRRSKTSRGNLGENIPEALSPAGTTVVAVRLPNELVLKLDGMRGQASRSEYIRGLIENDTGPAGGEK